MLSSNSSFDSRSSSGEQLFIDAPDDLLQGEDRAVDGTTSDRFGDTYETLVVYRARLGIDVAPSGWLAVKFRFRSSVIAWYPGVPLRMSSLRALLATKFRRRMVFEGEARRSAVNGEFMYLRQVSRMIRITRKTTTINSAHGSKITLLFTCQTSRLRALR